ncbi:MAG TPA: helix-turn-helix domain-containing protein [Terracidiphilus sp.]|nr:helix-turn-helix domain-containing protein [Terracidiphilus sp.]
MATFDEYVTDTLMRDLVGHDHKPVGFLVYLWIAAEQQRRGGEVRVSYREVAESIGVSKSSVQAAVAWLVRRKLLAVRKETVTATPAYTARAPWRDAAKRMASGKR